MRRSRILALLPALAIFTGCTARAPVAGPRPGPGPTRAEDCRLPAPVVNIWPLVSPGTPWAETQSAGVLHVRVATGSNWALLTATAHGPYLSLVLTWNRGKQQESHHWAYARLSPSLYTLAADQGKSLSRLGIMSLLALEAYGVPGGIALVLPASVPARFSYQDGIIGLFHHRFTVWYRVPRQSLLPPQGASDLSLTVGQGNPLGSPPRITDPPVPARIRAMHGWTVHFWQSATAKGRITEAQWSLSDGTLLSLHGLEVPLAEISRVVDSFAACPVRVIDP